MSLIGYSGAPSKLIIKKARSQKSRVRLSLKCNSTVPTTHAEVLVLIDTAHYNLFNDGRIPQNVTQLKDMVR
jgi:hypothetical protein